VKVYVQGSGSALDLTQRDYVASGGQGAIYARGGTAYKIYHDPSKMIPPGKVHELAAITDPRVIRPQQMLLDAKSKVIGYTSRFVKDAFVLCQLFPRSFREREGVTHDMILELVRKLQEGIQHVHRARILLVDLNEMNFLVPRTFDDIYFIDTDSYQTPKYPAPALMESVRDWSVQNNKWTENSDWFSFGVVAFQMFVGVHPFKGQYHGTKDEFRVKLPTDDPADGFAITRRRMQHSVSVFDPRVKVPAAVYPFDVIPPAYRKWFEAVFAKGARCVPPSGVDLGVVVFVPVVQAIAGAGVLDIMEIGDYGDTVTRVWGDSHWQHLVVVTGRDIWLDKHGVRQGDVRGCGFCPKTGRVVAVTQDRTGVPNLYNLTDRVPVPFAPRAEEISSHNGRIYLRTEDQILEVVLTDAGSQVIASTRPVVNCLPHATRLYPGVVMQDMLGARYASLLVGPGFAPQVRLRELEGYKVLDAKYDCADGDQTTDLKAGGVLMVVRRKGAQTDRLIFRFDPQNWDSYDVREVLDITPAGLNFVVLDSGVCVSLTEEDKLELFSSRKDSTSIKTIEDPELGSDMTLAKWGGSVVFARGSKVFSLKRR